MATATESFDARLARLWQEGGHAAAVAFLRRALDLNETFEVLAAALRLEGVGDHLERITLRDVLGSVPAANLETPAVVARTPSPAATQAAARRPRRSRTETEQLQELLLARLREGAAGMTTANLCASLAQQGCELDGLRANALLKTMEKAKLVASDGGRPKVWRSKSQGRVVPEPVVIRKAHEQSREPEAGPEAPQTLLNHGDIQAAAALLRERFFAAKAPS